MPQHYGLNFEFDSYEQQRRQLERLHQTAPFAVDEARRFTETFYGSKQQGPCNLLPDEELIHRCRQGYLPQSYGPGFDNGEPGNENGMDSNGGNGGNGGNGNG